MPAAHSPLVLKDPTLLRQQCYIDGGWCDADDGRTLDVVNPATGRAIGTAPRMGGDETRRAIDAAARAFPGWAAKTAKERSAVLRRWFELITHNVDDPLTASPPQHGRPR